MKKFVLALICLMVPALSFGQMTTVTATGLKIGSSVITTGTVCAVATDLNDNPITVAIGGGGLQGAGQSCAAISAGTITTAVGGGSYVVADEALAGNSGFYYRFTVTDTSVGNPTSKMGFILPRVPGVTGSAFALDRYFPVTSVTTVPVFTFVTGAGVPTLACVGKSFYQDNTAPSSPVLYSCGTDLRFHIVTGTGGGGGATLPHTTSILKGDNTGGAVAAVAGTDFPTVASVTTAQSAATAAQTTANAAATPASVATAIKSATPQAILPFSVDAEWPFNDGTGTVVTDISGNGHNATFGSGANAPSWGTYGVSFSSTADAVTGSQFASTNITAFKSVIIAHCVYPEIQTSGTGGNVPYATAPSIWGSSTTDGINLSGGQAVGGGQLFGAFRPSSVAVSPFANKSVAIAGFGGCQTTALTIGATDALYENGLPLTLAQSGSSAAIVTSAGGYKFGSGGFGGTTSTYRGTITYALLSVSNVWTAAQVQQLNTYIQAKLAARNMPVYPTFNQAVTNQLIFVGDSIWSGHLGTGVWTSLLTLNNPYTVSNWAISGMNVWDVGRLAESRWYSQIAPTAARNVVVIEGGTNDLVNTFTPAVTWASIVLAAKKAIAVGAIPVASTLISRTGQDTAQAPLNALIRANWKSAGFAALLDVAELPVFANGGSTNLTFYNADGIHPVGGAVCTVADGYGNLCFYTQKLINTLDGSSAINPDVTASNAFVAADANNYVIQTPTAAATYKLVPCAAITGQTKTIINGSTGFVITVSATAPDTIVGATSIPAGGSLTYVSTLTSPTAGGCFWTAK